MEVNKIIKIMLREIENNTQRTLSSEEKELIKQSFLYGMYIGETKNVVRH